MSGSDGRRMYQRIENSTRIRPLSYAIAAGTSLSCQKPSGKRMSRERAVVGIAALQVRENLDLRGQIPGIRAESSPENLDLCRFAARLPSKCGPVGRRQIFPFLRLTMAKAVTIKVKLVSSADTGFYYVAKKNSRTMTDKLVKKKYDPVARKHVEFREAKIK